MSEALCDIVGTVLYDRGTTLVSGFDYYVCVRREFCQCSEVIRFGVFLPWAGGYAVLQAHLVQRDDGFEVVAAHRGIILAFRLELVSLKGPILVPSIAMV